MLRHVAVAALLAVLTAGCAAHASRPAAQPSSASRDPQATTPRDPQATTARDPQATTARDPHTAAALVEIATVFNDDYDSGVYGPVWDRWDARSQAIITRADYIQRHTECPDSPQSATVEDASPGRGGAWIVDYAVGGVQLHDYWFYVHGRWVFDLVLSNPDSVKLYRLSSRQYIAALGCAH